MEVDVSPLGGSKDANDRRINIHELLDVERTARANHPKLLQYDLRAHRIITWALLRKDVLIEPDIDIGQRCGHIRRAVGWFGMRHEWIRGQTRTSDRTEIKHDSG